MIETLNLEELKARRSELESELNVIIPKIVTQEIKNEVANVDGIQELKISSIQWEFHGEYDDEGGTDYRPNYITATMEDEREIDEIIFKEKSKYSDTIYETTLDEIISEILHDKSDDLYKYDIDSINLEVH